MLFFHDLKDFINRPLTIVNGPIAEERVLSTFNGIQSDLLDYHLDWRRWWEQNNNRSYYRIHLKKQKRVTRQATVSRNGPFVRFAGIVVSPDYGQSWPEGTVGAYFLNGLADVLSPTPFPGQATLPAPPSGSTNFYWQTFRGLGHYSGGFLIPDEEATIRNGSFVFTSADYNMPDNEFHQAQILTPVSDEYITNFKMARLNYRTFVDVDVATKTETPQKTNLVIEADAINGIGSFSDGVIRPVELRQPHRTFFTTSDSLITISKGEKSIAVSAGLPYIKGLRLRINSRGDGSRWIEGVVTTYNDDSNDEFLSPSAQISAGLFYNSGIVAIQNFGEAIIFFPDRSDIMPVIYRPFLDSVTERDFRAATDFHGLLVKGEPGYGIGVYSEFQDAYPFDFAIGGPGTIENANGKTNSIIDTTENVVVSDDGFLEIYVTESTRDINESFRVELTIVD